MTSGAVPAPFAEDEAERILALESYEILDTPPEESFDRVARLAREIFEVPIALVSLVDRERQWFKSCFGLDSRETHRDSAFCAHAILSDAVMIVPDARLDPRFAGNPLVTGPPGIRFYAGSPLETREGFRLGTLCVIDTEPRPGLSDRQRKVLVDLSRIVTAELELRRDLGLTHQREMSASETAAEQLTFLSWLSHELRTPMTSVIGFAELLETTDLDATQARHLRRILEGGQRTLGLIDDILDFTRVEAGRLEITPEDVELAPVVAATVDVLEQHAHQYQVHIQNTVPSDLAVVADEKRLGQVVMNLLTNAVKYNEPGGRVTIAAKHAGDVVKLSVEDTGVGIAFADQQRVFEPFERVHETADGAGLGLALARRLVEEMGGAMRLRSTPGIGSVFEVDLLPASGATAELEPAGRGDGAGLVVHIDGDPADRALLVRVVGRVGDVELLTADSAEDGLALVRDRRPAAVLLGLDTPDASVASVLAEMRSDPALVDVPVIVISGDPSRSSREQLLAAGATEYVTKPIDVRALVDLLRAALD